MKLFSEEIIAFNRMYKLPASEVPTLDVGVPVFERLKAFKKILYEELNEIDEILNTAALVELSGSVYTHSEKLTLLTNLADLLGDIQVYCASEMAKFGLPLDETLSIIMESNFSKLGADGLPIYDERGKVMKGPDYWKPEPTIRAMLEERMDAQQR